MYISTDGDSFVRLTKQGQLAASALPRFHFNGWDYRGRERIFFARLSLLVQTVSNFKAGEKLFLPTQRDREVQLFVKRLLYQKPIGDQQFSREIGQELYRSIERSGMKDQQKIILTHRLDGYGCTGWTWNQLAGKLELSPLSLYLYFIEGLHLLLASIEQSIDTPLLRKMTNQIKVTSYLTDSSMKTKSFFEQGMSMAEIAATRRLKMSTIEDHFVEMSINDVDFPIEQFVSKNDINAVMMKVTELKTKRLRLLKDEFPLLSYFQLRLILGSQSGGEINWTLKQF